MLNVHLDNPRRIEEWIETLTVKERAIFDQGYLTAISGVVEQLRDSKIKLLNRIQEIRDHGGDERAEIQLLSRVRILEIYDEHYMKRVEKLSKLFEESPLLPAFE